MDKNLNTGYYKDFDTNFAQALQLAEREFSHDDLLNLLENGNIPEKQISALMFDKVDNEKDAEALINNLTGCDGKIREAVALKINQILETDEASRKFFVYPEVFAQATIDINANICRLVVDSANLLRENPEFSIKYTNSITEIAKSALDELDKFIFRDKKYVINKQLFKLYWCLEGLKSFYMFADSKDLYEIIEKCVINSEYTIREKTAQLIKIIGVMQDFEETLKNDENYYVRAVFE